MTHRSPSSNTSSAAAVRVTSEKGSLLDMSTLCSPSPTEVSLASDEAASMDLIDLISEEGDDVGLARFVGEEEDELNENSEERDMEEREVEREVEGEVEGEVEREVEGGWEQAPALLSTPQRGLSSDRFERTPPVPAPRKSLSASAIVRNKVGGGNREMVQDGCTSSDLPHDVGALLVVWVGD